MRKSALLAVVMATGAVLAVPGTAFADDGDGKLKVCVYGEKHAVVADGPSFRTATLNDPEHCKTWDVTPGQYSVAVQGRQQFLFPISPSEGCTLIFDHAVVKRGDKSATLPTPQVLTNVVAGKKTVVKFYYECAPEFTPPPPPPPPPPSPTL